MRQLLYVFLTLFLTSCTYVEQAEPQHINLYSGEWEYWPIETINVQLVDQVRYFLNNHRENIGIATLAKGSSLSSALAGRHCNYMIYTSKISHDGFTERSRILSLNGAGVVAENVAAGYDDPFMLVSAWLNSPSHREAIEGNYTHVGINAMKDAFGRYYFTAIFYN